MIGQKGITLESVLINNFRKFLGRICKNGRLSIPKEKFPDKVSIGFEQVISKHSIPFRRSTNIFGKEIINSNLSHRE